MPGPDFVIREPLRAMGSQTSSRLCEAQDRGLGETVRHDVVII